MVDAVLQNRDHGRRPAEGVEPGARRRALMRLCGEQHPVDLGHTRWIRRGSDRHLYDRVLAPDDQPLEGSPATEQQVVARKPGQVCRDRASDGPNSHDCDSTDLLASLTIHFRTLAALGRAGQLRGRSWKATSRSKRGSAGIPSTRSAQMFFWISSVPPAM